MVHRATLVVMTLFQRQVLSVYEKHFETSDFMSDVLEPCVGHFHIVLDIIMLTIILKTNLLILNIDLVFEIKGAPCTLCAHFGCRMHRF